MQFRGSWVSLRAQSGPKPETFAVAASLAIADAGSVTIAIAESKP